MVISAENGVNGEGGSGEIWASCGQVVRQSMAAKAIIVGVLPLHACTLTSACQCSTRAGSGVRSAHDARCVQWEVGVRELQRRGVH